MGFGGGSSAPAAQTVTQVQQLPPWVQPYGEQLLNRGVSLSNQSYQPYPGQRVAPLSSQHQQGIDRLTQMGTQGDPAVNASQNFVTGLSQGQFAPRTGFNPFIGAQTPVGQNPYAGSNPYFEDALSRTLGDVRGQVNSQFAGNAFGGSAHQEQLGRTLGDVATRARMDEYGRQAGLAESDIARRAQYGAGDITRSAGLFDTGLDRRLAAQQGDVTARLQGAGLAPGLQQAQTQSVQNLLSAGDITRQFSQDQLNQKYEDWVRQQQYPYQQLDVLSNSIRGATGGGGSTVTQMPAPYQPSPYAASLGLGLAGYGLGSASGAFNPWLGAAGGAVLPWLFR